MRTDTGPRTKNQQSFRTGRNLRTFWPKALPPAAALAGSVHSIRAMRVRGALCIEGAHPTWDRHGWFKVLLIRGKH